MNDMNFYPLLQDLVDLMKKNGSLRSPAIEKAFLAVPRHHFLPGEPIERAYQDIAIAVRKGPDEKWTSSSSQPTMMAIMLEQLDLRPGHRVLEIGTGTGYNAALMAEIVGPQGRVVTVDIQPDLIAEAQERLDVLGYDRVEAIAGDGGYGYPQEAPYDRIILTVGSQVIAPTWREQLAEGGRLVLPLAVGKTQKSIAFERREDELVSATISDCGFMMLQGAYAGSPPARTQIGPDPRLNAQGDYPLPLDPDLLNAMLDQPGPAFATGVEAGEFAVWMGLPTWLTIHTPDWQLLSVEDELSDERTIPELFYMGSGDAWRVKQAFMLADQRGAALITRPPGQPAPFIDWNTPDDEERPPRLPFELNVCQLGPDPTAANRLLELVQGWGKAGQPGSDRLHIRAVPAEKAYQLAPGEYLVEKPWTNLVIWFS